MCRQGNRVKQCSTDKKKKKTSTMDDTEVEGIFQLLWDQLSRTNYYIYVQMHVKLLAEVLRASRSRIVFFIMQYKTKYCCTSGYVKVRLQTGTCLCVKVPVQPCQGCWDIINNLYSAQGELIDQDMCMQTKKSQYIAASKAKKLKNNIFPNLQSSRQTSLKT